MNEERPSTGTATPESVSDNNAEGRLPDAACCASSLFCEAVIGGLVLLVPGIIFKYDENYLPLPWVYQGPENSMVYRAMTQAGMVSRALEAHGQRLCSHWTAGSQAPPERPHSAHLDLPEGWPDEFRAGSPIRSLAASVFLRAIQTPTQHLPLGATPGSAPALSRNFRLDLDAGTARLPPCLP